MARTDSPRTIPAGTGVAGLGCVVVPAHDEAAVIGRLLRALTAGGVDLEVVVVANGCTDATAEVARAFPGVRVLETPVPSKMHALALGDRHVSRFPRFYVDADVVIGTRDLSALGAALSEPGVHAAGPERSLDLAASSWPVRAYYSVWCRLPGVERELYGRGVIAVDEAGHRRIAGWRDTMADDLVAAMSFTPEELRVVPGAHVLIRPPRTYGDLLRRRVRAMTGNRQLAGDPDAPPLRGAGGGVRTVVALVRRDPALLPAVTVFLGTAVLARARARWAVARGSTVWLRDESSRRVDPPAGPRSTPTPAASTSRAERSS
ncbi:Glycosyl transferase family 2 [Georgenia satyanarayanai]|uniref:Glycosyl transferase family 2 n=1 Tax=Georgenia satyanarayanai TaxID=860221 RepID=A0A2Y9AGX9_9MICO|nr:glycosyltransferase [Georgenia satyanarayanai]PYF99673.1 glycosyl transferase family 2 [Georgenia satyanarayanai]SSA42518.1 Glycosyl transferase family 2 [Georgenia satyanarayanai]